MRNNLFDIDLDGITEDEFIECREMFDIISKNTSDSGTISFIEIFLDTIGVENSWNMNIGEEYYINPKESGILDIKLCFVYSFVLRSKAYKKCYVGNILSYVFLENRETVLVSYRTVLDIIALFALSNMKYTKNQVMQLASSRIAAGAMYDCVISCVAKKFKNNSKDIGVEYRMIKEKEGNNPCDDCIHTEVCKYKESIKVPSIDLPKIFSVDIRCKHFLKIKFNTDGGRKC